MRLFLYSNGNNYGFFANGADLIKAHGRGRVRPYKSIIEDEEIPKGWKKCEDDRTAIEKIPTMKNLIKQLS
jgi:hypothetical protein